MGGGGADKSKNLFSGRMKCLCCGGSVHFVQKGPKERYLRCEAKHLGAADCYSKTMNYETIERLILLELVQIDWPSLLNKPEAQETALNEREKAGALEVVVKEHDRKIGNLVQALAASTKEMPALVTSLEKEEEEKEAAQSSLDLLKESLANGTREREDAFEAYLAIPSYIDSAKDPELRFRLKGAVADLVSSIFVKKNESGEIVIFLKFNENEISFIHSENSERRVTVHSSACDSLEHFRSGLSQIISKEEAALLV